MTLLQVKTGMHDIAGTVCMIIILKYKSFLPIFVFPT